MPELPEVEHLRRTLEPRLIGRTLERVDVRRADVVDGDASPAALLAHDTVVALRRKGKQLAILGASGRALCVHLGMTGQLTVGADDTAAKPHTHIAWSLAPAPGRPETTLAFRDPRRFGGVWTFPSFDSLRASRWDCLGPDALEIDPGSLRTSLADSRRPIKAALLDQAVVAGVGNIYADESLFLAGVKPSRPAHTLAGRSRHAAKLVPLCRAIRETLARAIEAGGSSVRDYVDATGSPGGYQGVHLVYGRRGLPCTRCGAPLRSRLIAQRTTVWCPDCQS